MPKKGFTLIELLIVIGIFGVLVTVGIVSYSALGKNTRDAKRQADLASIRTALEQYRTATSSYPKASSWQADLEPTYINPLPQDPKTNADYTYTPVPAGCNGTSTSCVNYTVSATLESTGQPYMENPYGVITPTIAPTATPTSAPPTATPTPTPTTPACLPLNASCTADNQCCNGNCGNGNTRCCLGGGSTCTQNSDCCDNSCSNGTPKRC